eukprot:TRINITY_DN12394_c0_g1_i1.p1 TRINITY_DN12394_c0_g1~~TRINITY_DN12394_c0_g1_i1.p1  ORF type:complete len:349 (-),score=35.97 TRINITY_DN12394_c0_g1_i1:66-1112(-)
MPVHSAVCNGRFQREMKLNEGSKHVEIYTGKDAETGQDVVLTIVENDKDVAKVLEREAQTLKLLQKPLQQGIPKFFHYGQDTVVNKEWQEFKCSVLATERLGPSLTDHVDMARGRLTPQTCVLVAQQALQRLEFLHSKGIVHRDIQPCNFSFGVGEKMHHLYLTDFGLSRSYWEGGKHIRQGGSEICSTFPQTGSYTSTNVLKGSTYSRRDDLESLGYTLLRCLRGDLPFLDYSISSVEAECKAVLEGRSRDPVSEHCKGFPTLGVYLEYTRNLQFTEMPDYGKLHGLFAAERCKYEGVQDSDFEWFARRKPPVLVPLEPRTEMRQPDTPGRRGLPTCCSGLFSVCSA